MSSSGRFETCRRGREVNMSELMTRPDKLRADAAECALIRDLATDGDKRELFARLAEHLSKLAAEVERAARAHGTSLS